MTAIRTIARALPPVPLPTSIATRRTAAMSMPNRVAAPTTNASCVATVICPNAADPLPNACAIRMFIPKLAITKMPRPTTFWPVPARIVLRSCESSPPRPRASPSRLEELMCAKYARAPNRTFPSRSRHVLNTVRTPFPRASNIRCGHEALRRVPPAPASVETLALLPAVSMAPSRRVKRAPLRLDRRRARGTFEIRPNLVPAGPGSFVALTNPVRWWNSCTRWGTGAEVTERCGRPIRSASSISCAPKAR